MRSTTPCRVRAPLQVIAAKEAGSAAPVKNIEGNTFLYTRHKDMFFVAVTRSNANAELIFAFLYGAHGARGGARRRSQLDVGALPALPPARPPASPQP